MPGLNLLENLGRPDPARAANQRLSKCLFGLVVAAHLSACLFTIILTNFISPDDFLAVVVYCGFGFVVSGPVVSCIFGSLLSIKWLERLIGLTTSVVICVAALFVGMFMGYGILAKSFFAVTPSIPFAVLVVCLPFLAMRYGMGWHIIFDAFHESPQRQSISIWGLMLVMGLFAVCIRLMQFGDYQSETFVVSLGLAGICLTVLVPLTLFMMRSNNFAIIFGCSCILAFLFGFLGSIVLDEIWGSNSDLWQSFGIGLSVTASVSLIGIALIACRLSGGKLIVGMDLVKSPSQLDGHHDASVSQFIDER